MHIRRVKNNNEKSVDVTLGQKGIKLEVTLRHQQKL
jgi:hypothetical protein